MRKFILWFFSLAILMVLFAIGAYLLAKKYEEPVRNYIVERVNDRLQAPVHVADINFSILERFPSASLVMDDVWAEENYIRMGSADTLFYFEKVYLNLNIFDVLNGIYRINEIEVRDGFLRLLVDEDGHDNYHIWKESSDTTGFLLELDKVHIENTSFTFLNEARQQRYDLTAYDLYFNGRFSEDNYTMAVYGDGLIHDMEIKGTSYLKNRLVDVESDLDVLAAEEQYAFRKGDLTIDEKLTFRISGKFVGDGVDLRIKGEQLDIIHSLSLIPHESRAALDAYESTGELTFECTLIGAFGKTENPALVASFSFNDATIAKKGSNWKLEGLKGTGQLDNGANRNFSTVQLDLIGVSGTLNGDTFQSSLRIKNFNRPTIAGDLAIRTDLAAIKNFFSIEELEEAKGLIDLSARIEATIEDMDHPKPSEFFNSSASGSILLSEAFVRLKGDNRDYSIKESKFELKNNDLLIHYYRGKINETILDLSGVATGFLGYVFTDDGELDVKGDVATSSANLDELFPSSSNSKSGVVAVFPKRAYWNLNIISERFQLRDFVAEEISGKLVMTPFKIEAKQLHFRSQKGDVQGTAGIYRFSENQVGIRTNFDCSRIDVKELFGTFNNFDQSFIQSEVIEGNLTASIVFQALSDSLLNIDTRSITANAEVKLENGSLTGFDPLISIADELRKKPLMRLFISVDELEKRLQTVKFATLENEISIRDGIITIPRMEIMSSALNINISGTHTFENEIDYSLDFAMSEVLELKNRTEPYNEYVKRDEKGRTRIYLTMKGTTDDYQVEVERSDIKQTVKSEIEQEKQTVKGILKQEFGANRSDSSTQSIQSKPKELQIEFDPEASNSDKAAPTEKEPKKEEPKKEKGLLDKLIKKTEADKKKLKEGEFDDDDF